MLLEVCANSYQSALNAEVAGAKRIELCEDLAVGGITPGTDLIKKVLKHLSIVTFILIRPRKGDFVYTDQEFEQMKQSILQCKKLGSHGIVSGVLNANNTIDMLRTKELIELSKPLPFTFHRAFDEIQLPREGLRQLIELDVDRVLTSGQKETAEKGIELLRKLKELAKDKIIILPGAGITTQNAHLFKQHQFIEIHSSARSKNMNAVNKNDYSDQKVIRELLEIIS